MGIIETFIDSRRKIEEFFMILSVQTFFAIIRSNTIARLMVRYRKKYDLLAANQIILDSVLK
jgi:hypothetical protein